MASVVFGDIMQKWWGKDKEGYVMG